MPSRELALLIDGPNLHVTAKTLGFDIDYKRLLAEFQSRGCSARCIIAPIKIFQGSVRYSIGRETTGPPQRTTPHKRNILAWRRWHFHGQAIKIPGRPMLPECRNPSLVIARQ